MGLSSPLHYKFIQNVLLNYAKHTREGRRVKGNQRVNYIKFEWGTESPRLMYLLSIIFWFNADLSLSPAYYGTWCNFPLVACLGYKMSESKGQNAEPDNQDTCRKPYQSYAVRSPQEEMRNITSFHPGLLQVAKKEKEEERGEGWRVFCWRWED